MTLDELRALRPVWRKPEPVLQPDTDTDDTDEAAAHLDDTVDRIRDQLEVRSGDRTGSL